METELTDQAKRQNARELLRSPIGRRRAAAWPARLRFFFSREAHAARGGEVCIPLKSKCGSPSDEKQGADY